MFQVYLNKCVSSIVRVNLSKLHFDRNYAHLKCDYVERISEIIVSFGKFC